MTATIGHNGGPDIDGPKQSLRTQWAKALFADPETPAYVMAIAWAVHWYSRADGTGAALSNAQLEVICGISSATATRGKAWLRDNGYVQLRVGTGTTKTSFRMAIPEMGVITQIAPSESVPDQADDGSNQADDGGVITETTNIQERNSGRIQEKRDEPSGRANFWREAFNPSALHSEDIVLKDGKPFLTNGTRSLWLERFDNDEKRLDMALIQISGFIQPNSNRPLPVQVESQLARFLNEEMGRDKRYRKAIKSKEVQAEPSKHEKLRAMVHEAVEAEEARKGGQRR